MDTDRSDTLYTGYVSGLLSEDNVAICRNIKNEFGKLGNNDCVYYLLSKIIPNNTECFVKEWHMQLKSFEMEHHKYFTIFSHFKGNKIQAAFGQQPANRVF